MNTATFLLYIAPVLLVVVGAVAYWLTGRADASNSPRLRAGD